MRRIAALLVMVTLPACTGPASPDGGLGCSQRQDVDTFAPGLVRTSSSGISITLEAADPAPPERGQNTWWLRLTGQNGTPIIGAAPTVVPYMPEHGHGPPTLPTVTSDGGLYEVNGLNLFMPSVWQVTISPSRDAGIADQAKFTFCVDG